MNDNEFHNYVSETQENICQITALKNGTVFMNETWHDYKTTDTVHVMSATKSVVSLLIGIAPRTNYYAETAEEHKAFTMSKKPHGNIWFVDPKGIGAAGYGLCMSAEEMAKIGQMCLDGGTYGGRRIVSSEWIAESTRPHIQCDGNFRDMLYGYLWWIIDEKKHIYAAIGNSGNVIYVNSEKAIVVAVAATFKPTVFDRIDFIQEHIEPLLDAPASS